MWDSIDLQFPQKYLVGDGVEGLGQVQEHSNTTLFVIPCVKHFLGESVEELFRISVWHIPILVNVDNFVVKTILINLF